jgi:hypothetical protein
MLRLGIEAGPEVGRVKDRLEQAVLDGRLPGNAPIEAYREFLNRLAGEAPNPPAREG